MSIKLKSKVAHKSGDGYFIGDVTKIKGSKFLVFFKKRGLSRWINKSNLDEIEIIEMNKDEIELIEMNKEIAIAGNLEWSIVIESMIINTYREALKQGLDSVGNCTICDLEINYKGICESCYTNKEGIIAC